MKVVIVNESKEHIASRDLKLMVGKIRSELLGMRLRNRITLMHKSELTVVFLDTKAMKKINHQFRQKNKPTDILSFASDDKGSLGELLLCMPVLKRQAREHGLSVRAEMCYMLIHGILHLLGYDHELSAREERLMFSIQDRCFERVAP